MGSWTKVSRNWTNCLAIIHQLRTYKNGKLAIYRWCIYHHLLFTWKTRQGWVNQYRQIHSPGHGHAASNTKWHPLQLNSATKRHAITAENKLYIHKSLNDCISFTLTVRRGPKSSCVLPLYTNVWLSGLSLMSTLELKFGIFELGYTVHLNTRK